MKIVIINGSPKGRNSVSLAFAKYVEKKNKNIEFETFHVGQKIKTIEKNRHAFDEVIKAVDAADGVIWVYPVYVFFAPAQMHRFFELIKEREVENVFAGKYATSILTSMHFYDTTAEAYVHGICEDMGMSYFHGFSGSMFDFIEKAVRDNLAHFADHYFSYIENKTAISRRYPALKTNSNKYTPDSIIDKTKTQKYKVTVITESLEAGSNLEKMMNVFKASLPNEVDIVELDKMNIKGGCLGCLHCSYDGECIYKDDFQEMNDKYIKPSNAYIFALDIKGRCFSSRWKMFMDRRFSNGHRVSQGAQYVGAIVAGNLQDNENVRTFLDAQADMARSAFEGNIVSDEGSSDEITLRLEAMANNLLWSLERNYSKPRHFYGIGGHMIFRELIYMTKGMQRKDYKYYKKNKMLDVPQKKIGWRVMNFFMRILMKFSGLRRILRPKMLNAMTQQFDKIIEKETE